MKKLMSILSGIGLILILTLITACPGPSSSDPKIEDVTVSVGDNKLTTRILYDESFKLTITCSDPIYYTLDGSAPEMRPAHLYNRPIPFEEILQNVSNTGKFTLQMGRYLSNGNIFQLLDPYRYEVYFVANEVEAREAGQTKAFQFKSGTEDLGFATVTQGGGAAPDPTSTFALGTDLTNRIEFLVDNEKGILTQYTVTIRDATTPSAITYTFDRDDLVLNIANDILAKNGTYVAGSSGPQYNFEETEFYNFTVRVVPYLKAGAGKVLAAATTFRFSFEIK